MRNATPYEIANVMALDDLKRFFITASGSLDSEFATLEAALAAWAERRQAFAELDPLQVLERKLQVRAVRLRADFRIEDAFEQLLDLWLLLVGFAHVSSDSEQHTHLDRQIRDVEQILEGSVWQVEMRQRGLFERYLERDRPAMLEALEARSIDAPPPLRYPVMAAPAATLRLHFPASGDTLAMSRC